MPSITKVNVGYRVFITTSGPVLRALGDMSLRFMGSWTCGHVAGRESGVDDWPEVVFGFDFDAGVLDAGGGEDFGIELLAHLQHGESGAFGADVVAVKAGCGEFCAGRENERDLFAETVQVATGFECFFRFTEELDACAEPLEAGHGAAAKDDVVEVFEEIAEKRHRVRIDPNGDQVRTEIRMGAGGMRDNPAKVGVLWLQV